MNNAELFDNLLNVICEQTQLSRQEILSHCKSTQIVDARYILVKMLYDSGFYPSVIASFIHQTERSVTKIMTNFDNRKEKFKMLRINYEQIKNLKGINKVLSGN